MSQQPSAPRPALPDGPHDPSSAHRPRKISTACGACKQRKTKAIPRLHSCRVISNSEQCTGGSPCEACAIRRSLCVYDATSDQRRKIANQKNVQDLAEKQHDLEKHQQLLGGIIATIRAGGTSATEDLIRSIRSGIDLSQLAAHVRNECRTSIAI